MNIKNISLRRMKLKLKDPFQTSFGTQTEREFIIVEVQGENHVGYGECVVNSAPFYNEETVKTAWHIMEDFLIPRIYSQSEINHPDEVSKLFKPFRRNNMAKAALEGAIWDLYAKENKITLSEALGGSKKSIDVGISIGIQPSVDELVRVVGKYVNEGYKRIKIKIKPGIDVDALKAVRKQFPTIQMMADANSAYTLDDIEIFKELDQLNLMMIEQPLAHDDIIDHAKLQSQIKTPICLDESIHSLEDAKKAIELGSCRIINLKIGRVGGLTESKKIHDYCSEKGIPLWCGGMLESGIGRAHNIAITSLSNFTLPGDTASSSRYWDEDIVYPEVTAVEGVIQIPETPGIGYAPQKELLDKYTEEVINVGCGYYVK
ncbi:MULTISPECIES: o-succinylbenzoate synthase [Cytobacillus]|uniref:o-succinylbenzoate synthase n=1 Tax=Cytobacillus kochii TaxID=859143 RepID=A0A248TIX9_9BACI|nr:o-succinylbenzoate synthase [Cytobacillus kochii]ASV68115.1 o-succinylbenzoate synthase [Cytobacillus kochii]